MESLDINSLISDLALILVLGAIATVVFKMLKQPIVLGYIVAGFLASPHFSLLPSVAVEANIEFWAEGHPWYVSAQSLELHVVQ